MEERSNLGNGSAMHEVKVDESLEMENGLFHDPEDIGEVCFLGECNDRLRGLFDDVLSAFLSERSGNKCFRPVPVLRGDGRPVDLYKLFWVVRKIGGYDEVGNKKLWGFAVEQCGLGYGHIALVKLIYDKYLKEFDQWLWNLCRESSLEEEESEVCRKLDLFSQELEAKFRGLLLSEGKKKKLESDFVNLEYDKCSKYFGLADSMSETHLSDIEKLDGLHRNSKCENNNVVEKVLVENNKGLDISGKRVVIGNESSDNPKQLHDNNGECCSQEDNDLGVSAKKFASKSMCKEHEHSENFTDDAEDGFCRDTDDNIMVSAKNVVDKVLDSRKRRRGSSFSGMLKWIKHVAPRTNDPAIGRIPECSKWKNDGTDKPWIQALLVREARLMRRPTNLNAEKSVLQPKKLKMSPSLYENDDLNEKLRSSRRQSYQSESHFKSCSTSCPATQTEVVNPQPTDSGHGNKETAHSSGEASEITTKDDVSDDELPDLQVSVGPLFQAEVPEWTGRISHSDSKWLGTRMWPPEDGQNKLMTKLPSIGKGRENACDCPFPDSVECVRFHVAEKRLKLKLQLGPLFYRWRFHRMGEEVSLSWTAEEENRFKELLISYTASGKKFWTNVSKNFQSKTREMLVSYYFNVFLVQRRSYQNRVTPKDVDSDDDEKQFGSVGERFGYAALRVPDSCLLTCTLNQECTDLE